MSLIVVCLRGHPAMKVVNSESAVARRGASRPLGEPEQGEADGPSNTRKSTRLRTRSKRIEEANLIGNIRAFSPDFVSLIISNPQGVLRTTRTGCLFDSSALHTCDLALSTNLFQHSLLDAFFFIQMHHTLLSYICGRTIVSSP